MPPEPGYGRPPPTGMVTTGRLMSASRIICGLTPWP